MIFETSLHLESMGVFWVLFFIFSSWNVIMERGLEMCRRAVPPAGAGERLQLSAASRAGWAAPAQLCRW